MRWRHHCQQVASQEDHDLPCSADTGLQKHVQSLQSLPFPCFAINNILYTALPALGSRVFRRNSYHLDTCTCVCVEHCLEANSDSLLPSQLAILHALYISIWHPLVPLSYAKLS